MNSCAENWYRYGVSDVAPMVDVQLPAGAALRIYPDGSSLWKTRKDLVVCPSIWDAIVDPPYGEAVYFE
jgi:hypothetical protein